MEFRVILQKWQGTSGYSEHIVEADNLMVDEGTLVFYEGKGEHKAMLAYFAPGLWRAVFRVLDGGDRIAMRDAP